ncbi:hypothetical protein [Leuconostoc fallax]|uniref:hypothetical protein n=1 Tax=Leuconostoc fallax TaxID=1251 RepID=UPI0003105F80|nr:hypothetical protein [Leuconostoc fallax]
MKIKFTFLGTVFALLVMIGVIAINNTTMPAPLPVDGAISLMVGNTSNDKTYQTLQEITKKTI